MSDSELIARVVLDDDPAAFAKVVARHQSAVRNALRQWTAGDDRLADELAHETFLRAYRGLAGFRGGAKFSTWLYRIACNVFQSHVRALRPHEPIEDHEQQLTQSATTGHSDLQHDVQEAIRQLDERGRLVISLCFPNGLTHEEASEVLQWPLGTVKTEISRAKDKMQRVLAPWADRRQT